MQLSKSTRGHYTVSYDSASHWSVLTQMWGSAWPRVLPYCVLNVIVMLVLTLLDKRYSKALKIKISAQGHTVRTFFSVSLSLQPFAKTSLLIRM
jgi:pyruvate dehydrogenase complex dehydrogenase (E1) component